MVQRVSTVAFEGIEARAVDVQVQVAPGLPAFNIVGLPDKAVSEAKERVRAALVASGLALPARRITINLAPADLPKEGSHYDLPIALGLMAAIGAIPHDAVAGFTVLGELGLDGTLAPVAGVLPAAIGANARGEGLICPRACGPEAAWASPEMEIIAPTSLIQLANHFKGTQVLTRPAPKIRESEVTPLDLADIKGQESGKRALEIAAAGGHNLLMVGPPGSGKSMLAARLPSILPPLSPAELLEVSMIASVAGEIADGALTNRRPFRSPHHSASMPALVGGGLRAKPGEISLAHHGVLFLDELPEFEARVLDSLRQPLETDEVAISRANHRVTYPARFMLVAAMPLRARKRSRLHMQARAECALRGRISDAAFRSAARSHRSPYRGAGRHGRRPDPAAAHRGKRRSRGPRGARPRHAGRTLRSTWPRRRAHQRTSRRPRPGRRCPSGRERIVTAARRLGSNAIVSARLSPGAAGRPHAGRSRRRREGGACASRRGPVVSGLGRRDPPGRLNTRASAVILNAVLNFPP